jgi:hypothetical protein
VAIYSPFASSYYDAAASAQGGGAQLQMTILARELAARGWRVAHVVLPIRRRIEVTEELLTLHERAPYQGGESRLGQLREAREAWRALKAVDARAYVIRGSSVNVAAVAEFARLHRRAMVYSTANDFDLTKQPVYSSRP